MSDSALAYTVIIPARLASTRLPNKPLADIAGVPMVVRVAQRVASGLPGNVQTVVAADDAAIVAACDAYGVKVVLTRTDHASGTDRLSEACDILGLTDDAIVVNVQGDEPLMDAALVHSVAALLRDAASPPMGTAAHAIHNVDEFRNPNVVKVVTDAAGMALYFSRAPIAWWRDGFADGVHTLPDPLPLRHIGIYSYRAGFIRAFPRMPQAPLERLEALEQLRALWHGHRIAVHVTQKAPGPGVDTPEDLERVRAIFGSGGAAL